MRRKPGGLAGLLAHRDFRLLWTGETVSSVGTSMALVGVPLLAVAALHASTFAVSALTAAEYLPWLVIGLPAGAWVDRLPARRLMVACDLISALLFASLPAAAWLGVLTIGQVLAVALLAGAANVLFSTAYQVCLPELVGAGDLMEGNAKLLGSAQVASVSGRGLAGLAAQAVGYAPALLVNAASFLVSAACLLAIRGPARAAARPAGEARVEPSAEARPAAEASAEPMAGAGPSAPRAEARPAAPRRATTVRAEVAAGLRFIAADPLLRRLTIYAAVANLTFAGSTSLFVVFLVRVVGISSASVGLLMAAGGIGGIGGALAARPLARRLGTARALLLFDLGADLLGLLVPLTGTGLASAWYILGTAAVSAGLTGGNIVVASFRQSYCPPAMLGRLTATQRFVAFGTIPLGALLAGGLGTVLGVRAALWLLMGGFALSGTLLLTSGIRSVRDLPAAPAPAPAAAPSA